MARSFCHPEADPTAHRISPAVGTLQPERVQYRDNVGHIGDLSVSCRMLRLVTQSMSPSINHHQLIGRRKHIDISRQTPILQALAETMLQHEGWTASFGLVVNAYAAAAHISHYEP